MSIKEEGYLHDYIAVGLIGAFLGMVVASLWYLSNTVHVYFAEWGIVLTYVFVSGVFGFVPGGYVAGYLNYRIHQTEGGAMEGLSAGFMAAIAHTIITLFVFTTAALVESPAYAGSTYASSVMIA